MRRRTMKKSFTNRTVKLLLVSCASLLALAGSYGVWCALQAENDLKTPSISSTPYALDDKSLPPNGFANPLSKALAGASSQPERTIAPNALDLNEKVLNMNAARDLRTNTVADAAALRVLVHRYDTERDPHARETIKVLLSTINQPEVIELSKRLVMSGDAEKRRDGLELMQRLSLESADVRNVVKQVLVTEQIPSVLLQALSALKPIAVEPPEAREIVAQLDSLSHHADAAVRSQSILRLAQWDANGESAERIAPLLTDQAPDVRQAAVFALTQIKMRKENAKTVQSSSVGNGGERLR